jgi:hypothetical protein
MLLIGPHGSAKSFLLGILNPKSTWTFLEMICSKLNKNTLSPQTIYLSQIPIPAANESDHWAIEDLVQQCMDANENTLPALKTELDERVERLYGIKMKS